MSLSFRKHTVQLWKAHKVGFLFSVLKITCMQCNQRKGTCNATTEINVRQVKQMELISIGGLCGHRLCWDVIFFLFGQSRRVYLVICQSGASHLFFIRDQEGNVLSLKTYRSQFES